MVAIYILRSHLKDLKAEYTKALADPSRKEDALKLYAEIKHTEKVIARRITLYEHHLN